MTVESPTSPTHSDATLSRSPFANQTDFDSVAEEYDESLPAHVVAHYLAKRVAFIRDHAEPGLTLDVGCGTGQLAAAVHEAGYDVVGLDYSRGMLQVMRRIRPGIQGVAASSTRIPFPDNTFALTYCVAVMHHVADIWAVRKTLLEMVRVTRPGGHILVWDHNPRNPYWPLLMHRVPQDTGAERLIPEDEIVDGLVMGGAQIVLTKPLGFVPDFAPKSLMGVASQVEHIVEKTPVLNRLCAHNVILAVKNEA